MKTDEQKEFDEHCKFEDELINNRLTWLLASESLLFAGYGVILTSDKVDPAKIKLWTAPFLVVGLALSGLIFLSILAAVFANVHNWRKLKKKKSTVSLGVYPPATIVAWIVTCLVPLAFAAGWILIWINR